MRGADKLLEDVDGEPMLRRQARIACKTGCPVLVALPPDRPARLAALTGLDVQTVAVPDAAVGMSASMRRGVAAISAHPGADVTGLMILPADMPGFTANDLSAMIRAFDMQPENIWRGAAQSGQPGHPAIFPPDLWPALAAVTGDQGGIGVIRVNPDRISLFPFPGTAAVTDLDTPEDWVAWRAGRV